MSSTSSSADKVHRKSKGLNGGVVTLESNKSNVHGEAKVARRKSKGSNDVRNLELHVADKGHRRGRAAFGKSSDDGVRTLEPKKRTSKRVQSGGIDSGVRTYEKSSDGDRTLESKRRPSKRLQSRGSDNGADSYVHSNEKVRTFRSRGDSSLKTEGGREGFAAGTDGLKRKRIYAENGTVDSGSSYEGSMKQRGRKSLSKDAVGWNLDKGKKLLRGETRKFQDSGKSKLFSGSRKFEGTESFDKKNTKDKMKSAEKLKNVQEKAFGNTTSKFDKRKPSFAAKIDMNQRKNATDSLEKLRKNRGRAKKSLATDSDSMEDPPKKKKRVIRLDPHDTSNKRLNDDVAINGNGPEKKDLAENTHVEMSKNAQFRAIRPSPSILSFVEDNFLGRRREIEFRRAGYNIELSAPLDNIPFSTSSERERIEVPVFRNKLEFFAAAKISSSFPPPDLPEIAFAGRSNVGKSSLLNSLTRQWGVVRTSDKPGLTQTINFFKLGPKLSLVDLPGYGFAYAKEEVKESWEELVKEYVTSRVGLKRVCLLVDTQWGMKPRDHELIDLMERSQTKYQIVLTKTDLVFPIDVARRAMQIEENLKAKKSAVQPLMMVSSKTGAGIRSLRTVLANIARFARR